MPFYERPQFTYPTPPEVIEADWGILSVDPETKEAQLTMTVLIHGEMLTEKIVDWALAVFFMKPAFTTSVPNPFKDRNTPYAFQLADRRNNTSRFEIIYPHTINPTESQTSQ